MLHRNIFRINRGRDLGLWRARVFIYIIFELIFVSLLSINCKLMVMMMNWSQWNALVAVAVAMCLLIKCHELLWWKWALFGIYSSSTSSTPKREYVVLSQVLQQVSRLSRVSFSLSVLLYIVITLCLFRRLKMFISISDLAEIWVFLCQFNSIVVFPLFYIEEAHRICSFCRLSDLYAHTLLVHSFLTQLTNKLLFFHQPNCYIRIIVHQLTHY